MNEVLEQYKKLSKKHLDKIEYFNYPGLVIFQGSSPEWITQLKEVYGVPMVFTFVRIKDGKAFWEMPMGIGPAEKIIKQIKKEGLSYIKKDKRAIKQLVKKFDAWLEQNKIQKNKDLRYYINKLQDSHKILVNSARYLQISANIDPLLNDKIFELFKASNISAENLLRLCLPKEKAAINVHEEAMLEFIAWSKNKGHKLIKNSFQKLLINKEFKKRLKYCYNKGYFLYTSYGGVTFWSLEDEYNSIVEKARESKRIRLKQNKRVKVSLMPEQKLWIEASRHFSYLRDIRKTIQQKVFYYQALLLEEIAKRTNFISKELENLRVDQINLKNLSQLDKLKKIIKEQKKDYLFCWTYNKGQCVLVGNKATRAYNKYSSQSNIKGIKELKGQIACRGIARGIVKVIYDTHQKFTFNKGNILVTGMTAPNFLPLMKKAIAIVTEKGGVTCHAAIISRELNTPCIIDTKIATRLLKDGDLVEVDANKGIVKKLK